MIQVAGGIFRGPRVRPNSLTGVKCILDLETSQTLIGDHSPLTEAVTGDYYGIRVYSHPLSGFLPPTLKELRDAVQFMENKRFDGVYVHCERGHERTGIVCAAWRVLKDGYTPCRAIKEAIFYGFHWQYVGFWFIQLWRLKQSS